LLSPPSSIVHALLPAYPMLHRLITIRESTGARAKDLREQGSRPMPHCGGKYATRSASLANSCVPSGHSGSRKSLVASHTPISSTLHRAELYAHYSVPRSRFIIGFQQCGRSNHTNPPGRSVWEKGERRKTLKDRRASSPYATAHISSSSLTDGGRL
jgi:hypothetical protein